MQITLESGFDSPSKQVFTKKESNSLLDLLLFIRDLASISGSAAIGLTLVYPVQNRPTTGRALIDASP